MRPKAEPAPNEELTPDCLYAWSDNLRNKAAGGCATSMIYFIGLQYFRIGFGHDPEWFSKYVMMLPVLVPVLLSLTYRDKLINLHLDAFYAYFARIIKGHDRLSGLDGLKRDYREYLAGLRAGRAYAWGDLGTRWLLRNYDGFCQKNRIAGYPPAWGWLIRGMVCLVCMCVVILTLLFHNLNGLPSDSVDPDNYLLPVLGLVFLFGEGLFTVIACIRLRQAAILHVYAGLLREEQSGGGGALASEAADG